jgi:alpha/beta superfamily hydrolase
MKAYIEELVEFRNSKKEKLFGVVTTPTKNKNGKKIGFLFPNGGLMSREGHNRLHTRVARFMGERGYYCLRFSPHGLGNSEGEIEESPLPDLFGKIQRGLFIDDIKHAIFFFRNTYNIETLILLGVCGGAISVLLTINLDKDIDGIVLASVPIMLDSMGIDYIDRKLTREGAKRMAEVYLKKTKNFKSLWRFITFQSDYKVIKNIMVKNIKNYLPKFNFSNIKSDAIQSGKPEINDLFFSSCKECFKNKSKLLFIFGENDHFKNEFEESKEVEVLLNKYIIDDDYDMKVVKKANHMYTWLEFQEEIMNFTLHWTEKHFFKSDT